MHSLDRKSKHKKQQQVIYISQILLTLITSSYLSKIECTLDEMFSSEDSLHNL